MRSMRLVAIPAIFIMAVTTGATSPSFAEEAKNTEAVKTYQQYLGTWKGTQILYNGVDVILDYQFALNEKGSLVVRGTLRNWRSHRTVLVNSLGEAEVAGNEIRLKIKHTGGEADGSIATLNLVLNGNTLKGSGRNETLNRPIPSVDLKRVE